MRVQHNIAGMNSYRQFNVNNSKLSKNLEKLSSGYSINRAGDDAAGLAVSEKMRFSITRLTADVKNAKDGIGLIQTAEGALSEVNDMLNRMAYLKEQSDNGTYDATDQGNLNLEYKQLKNEISNIVKNTKFNGIDILNAGDGKSIKIGDSSLTVTFKVSSNDGGAQVVSGLSCSKLGLTASKLSGASTTTIETAIKKVASARAKLGSFQNRLEHTVNNLMATKENLTDAESRIRDTDMAEEMMAFTKNSIMNQAAQAMMAQSNQLPQGVLQLLQ